MKKNKFIDDLISKSILYTTRLNIATVYIEALKAKIKDTKNVKILFMPPTVKKHHTMKTVNRLPILHQSFL